MHTLGPRLDEPAAAALLGAMGAVSGEPSSVHVGHWQAFVAAEAGLEPSAGPALADETPSPARLAELIEAAQAEAALERLILAAMIVPPLDRDRLDRLGAYAAALELADIPALADLRLCERGHHRRLTAGLMRRFPPTERLRAAWRSGGLGGRWRLMKASVGLPDRATAARYRGLAELPEGTLGRGYYEHCRTNGFALPGERGGLPEAATFHDMGHVLAGAATDIAGETRMAGLEAGAMAERGFTMLEFALLLFNLGAKLPTDAKPAVGAIDMAVLLDGVGRGRRSSFAVLTWDPWADVEAPVSELRTRYAIEPWA